MFQIEKVFGFELSVLYSYPMRSAFAFVSELKCGKMWHSDPISFVSDPNPSLPWGWAVRTCRTGRMGAAWAAAWPAGFAYHGSYRRRESLRISIVLMCELACSLIVGRSSRTLPIQLLENDYWGTAKDALVSWNLELPTSQSMNSCHAIRTSQRAFYMNCV